MYPHQATPCVVWEPPQPEDEAVRSALQRDVSQSLARCGYLLRPHNPLFAPTKLGAVALDLDPTTAGSGRGELDPLSIALRGGSRAAGAGMAAPAGGPGGGGSRKAKAAAMTAAAPVGLNFRLRCAAAAGLGRWAASRLPAHNAAALQPHETYGGLALLLAVCEAAHHPGTDAAGGLGFDPVSAEAAAAGMPTPEAALHALTAYAAGPPGAARAAPSPPARLAELEVRQAALMAVAGVRHADGVTPAPVLALLTRALRSHDAGGGAGSALDGAGAQAALVHGLAQAVVDAARGLAGGGSTARSLRRLVADAHQALREVFALQATALRSAPRSPSASCPLEGTLASACLTALALVEGARLPLPLAPLLMNEFPFVSRFVFCFAPFSFGLADGNFSPVEPLHLLLLLLFELQRGSSLQCPLQVLLSLLPLLSLLVDWRRKSAHRLVLFPVQV
jgi:hypothetical protein